ncbi:hypothetical protein [Tenacibaculum dicentrarchi]|uniref:hypothetical protein n=1 Tax=Tenacibaculum dicentrarchi TaxID=669041 RepID=UPI00351605D3
MSKLLESIKAETIDYFGEEKGIDFFENFLKPVTLLKAEMKLIKFDLKHFSKTFVKIILPETKKFNRNLSKFYNEEKLFNSMTESSKNNEILSLAYMGLYHKIENYENRILWNYNIITQSNKKKIEEIGINIQNKEVFKERNRIRLICNSIKHNNCFPKKGLIEYYPDLDLNKQFDLTKIEFKDDIELINDFINVYNLLILSKLVEQSIYEVQHIENIEMTTKLSELKKTLFNFTNHLNENDEK